MDYKVEPYYNAAKTKVGVLISLGYGAGWSTWNHEAMAYDKRVIEWWLEHHDADYCKQLMYNGMYGGRESPEYRATSEFFKSIGYDDIYFGGYSTIELRWVPRGQFWRINEYDGMESLEFLDTSEWNVF